jgi:primosomal protein N' (replication factor Y)
MRAEERRGHVGYLSRALVQAMSRHLRAGGRVALLVSRRGYARVLLCRECGAAVRCPSCDIATAYDRDRGAVSCRVCGHTGRAPDLCPRCGGVGLRGVGAGTKRIEEVVHRLFPALRMARLDAETSRGAGRVLRDFAEGRLRLLVGTPMVLRARCAAAGRARPTLVGIVDADGPLYLPDFRAAEHTLQRLRAAAELPAPLTACAAAVPPPRAPSGARLAPEVIVQTRVPDHPVLRAFRTGDDAVFYDSELAARRDLGYPPYARLVRVVAESPTPEAARTLAGRVASAARGRGLDVLGPAPLLGRKTAGYGTAGGTRDRARVQCVLRVAGGALRVPGAPPADDADARRTIRAVLAEVPAPRGARIIVDVDPQEMV